MSKWTKEAVPDLTDRIALVTGSNTGLGFETARVLAGKGARVILAVRDTGKGEAASISIKRENPQANLEVRELDLASLTSVNAFSKAMYKDFQGLDMLINNAGVMMPPLGRTKDGFELQFGTNHLGHFALTAGLLALILASPRSRIINVSSLAHKSGKLKLEDLNWEKRRYRRIRAYCDSKLANLLFTLELDRRLKKQNLETLCVAAHPGWTSTDLQRHIGAFRHFNFMAMGTTKGALPILRAANEQGLVGGEYFGPGLPGEIWGYPRKARVSRKARNNQTMGRLWEASEDLTGISYDL